MRHLLRAFLGVCVACATALAFNGHIATEGPLTVTIAAVPTVQAFDVPQPFDVTLANSSAAPLELTLELGGLVDTCRAVGETKRSLTVPARGRATVQFQFACGRGTYSAHYPLHVIASFRVDGKPRTAHAVQIFQTDFAVTAAAAPAGAEVPVTRVPASGVLALAQVKTQRVAWSYVGQPLVREPVGWTGSSAASSASFSRGPVARGGESRAALTMHPPYRPRAGTVFAEYRLQLPATSPLRLEFFNAIRDSTPREGTSDGVTFRVWIDENVVFERHTDAKTWTAGDVDLSRFAGKEVLLRLESHPGPKNNTTCDSSFWGDPIIAAGARPQLLDAAGRTALLQRARRIISQRETADRDAIVYSLAGGCRAVVLAGPNGLADGAIAFGDGERDVVFEGLHMAVREHTLGVWPSAAAVTGIERRDVGNGKTQFTHHVRVNDEDTAVIATLWTEGPALRIKIESSAPITGLALNPADQRAPRVYYGHGYCIVDPEPFRAGAGGHNLATSHVGFDFERGISLLTASDAPVDHLQVDPARRIYQLHTHPDATLTFVPGVRGALDCAVRYRPLYDKPAAAGVTKKASRFVFDLWGGRYADNTAKLARCFDYGLTDSLVVVHNWQRWGYDYRLPDIFPPQPALGTLADLQSLGRVCTERGVLWGLHDNYIDLYPDATDFSYDHITFTADGRPRRAWLNESREAQSYQFRPDRIAPFLRRNLDLIVPALRPTASFVDVFASLNSFDFHDRTGAFHSKIETQRAWGEAFATIRDACGNHAPTISEAGSDHLIGWLDGADAQFMLLGPKPERFHNAVACRDWARVPWFDAVNHARFSLHGVGYSDRYQGGRSREEHGIESDDYLSAELLTGHALMIDLPGLTRGAVRKYWLAQDFIASVARDDIRAVEFAEGDVHRVSVTWNSGARVHVNRGSTDWTIDGRTLPPFGYRATHGDVESSIERIGGAVVEQSRARGRAYYNSRVFNPAAPLAITPRAEGVEYLGGRQFRLLVDWAAQRPAPKDCAVFYHFSRPTPGRRAATEFHGGGTPAVPTSQWQGNIVTGRDWSVTIPDGMPPGDYEILVGLHDPKRSGVRERLLGDEDPRRRYRIGKLAVTGDRSGHVTGVRFTPPDPKPQSIAAPANASATDFGPVATDGAFRVEIARDHVVLTPLPDGTEFGVRFRLTRLLGRSAKVLSLVALGRDGRPESAVPYSVNDDTLAFRTTGLAFAYRIDFGPTQ